MFVFVLWLSACSSGTETEKNLLNVDTDQDGFVAQEDCDDRDPFVYPGAEEICDGRDNNCNDEVDEGVQFVYYPDFDGDGFGDDNASITSCSLPDQYIAVGNDCDDSNSSIHPGAGELCDEIDNDCDGEIDEDLTDGFFLDEDGDGYGNTAVPAEDCDQLSEYVNNGIDCDDTNPEIFPFASEICDEIDNDCDGVVDEAGSGIALWYADGDGDGYGNLFDALNACTKPEGYVSNNDDCDDEDASQYPSADEVCNNEDDNCDGEIDENPIEAFVYYQDADNDGFGSSVTKSACSQPVGYISNQGDCDDTNPSISPVAPEICNNTDDDCDGVVDDNAIGMVTLYADGDGDGYGDIDQSILSCSVTTAGYVLNSLDCNDANAMQSPLGTEICNNQDDNCNGFLDEGASDAGTWFLDSDGDGYGDFTVWEFGCDAPVGYVSIAGDCDDSDPLYSPSTPETCDGTDENCNGFVDEGLTTYRWYEDDDGDGYGDPSTVIETCEILSGMVDNDDDCNDADALHNPDTPEICNDADDNCNGFIDDGLPFYDWYEDGDGDGFGDAATYMQSCEILSGMVQNNDDCDDTDPNHNPDTPETCDGTDENCNGQVDDGLTFYDWYEDNDGDGFGDPSSVMTSCDVLFGMVQNNDDCDDTDPNHNPDTPETCDGTDENCNNQVDEGLTRYSWYYDDDGDGYGDPFVALESCAQIPGMISDNSDCDDSDGSVNPGMDELCNDGIDNNCDGYLDDDSSVDAFVGYLDTDGDGYGGGALLSSCDDIYYATDDDCNDDDVDVYPGATEICDGIDNDCDGNIDTNSLCRNELSYCRLRRRQGSSYLFCRNNRTWSVAKGECASLGYHLVTINNSGEDTWLDGQVDNFSSSRQWWIGYNDITLEDYWDWDGPYGTYTNWNSGEPNDAGFGEDCVLLNQTNSGGWNDASCSTSTYFVCEANP